MTASDKIPKRGRPVDEALRDKIIQCAGKLFTDKGLHHTTMLDIAKEAHISKLTLYRRFENKEDLVQAVIHDKCSSYFPDAAFDFGGTMDVEETLNRLATLIMTLVTNETVGMEQAVISGGNQELAARYYTAGPNRTIQLVTEIFERLSHDGLLNISSPRHAAELFCAMFKGSPMAMQTLLGLPVEAEQIERYRADAVAQFLVCHRV